MGRSRSAARALRDERQTPFAFGMQKPDQPCPIAVIS